MWGLCMFLGNAEPPKMSFDSWFSVEVYELPCPPFSLVRKSSGSSSEIQSVTIFQCSPPPRWFCGKHCPCGFCGCWRVQRPRRKPVSMHLYLRSVKPRWAFIFNCGLLQVHWLCHREVGAWFCAIPCGKEEFNIVSIFNPDWLENIASLKERDIVHSYISALQVMPFSDYPL